MELINIAAKCHESQFSGVYINALILMGIQTSKRNLSLSSKSEEKKLLFAHLRYLGKVFYVLIFIPLNLFFSIIFSLISRDLISCDEYFFCFFFHLNVELCYS